MVKASVKGKERSDPAVTPSAKKGQSMSVSASPRQRRTRPHTSASDVSASTSLSGISNIAPGSFIEEPEMPAATWRRDTSRPQVSSDLQSFDYELTVRQQPKQARLCTGNDKQPKGPVEPPPVVRLQIMRNSPQVGSSASSSEGGDSNHSNLTSASLIQSPYLFCFAALCKADEDKELYIVNESKARYVTGNVVSSLYHLRDPKDGAAEGFLVFPDIGIRVEGTFRLKISLYEMVDITVHHCKTVYTDPFEVYSAKRFPGSEDSTELSKSFATQGLKMRIKGSSVRSTNRTQDDAQRQAEPQVQPSYIRNEAVQGYSKRPRSPDNHARDRNERQRLNSGGTGENIPSYSALEKSQYAYYRPISLSKEYDPRYRYERQSTSGGPPRTAESRMSAPVSRYGYANSTVTTLASISSDHDHHYSIDRRAESWPPPPTPPSYAGTREMPPPRLGTHPPLLARAQSDYRPDVHRHQSPSLQLGLANNKTDLQHSPFLHRPISRSGPGLKLPSLADIVAREVSIIPPLPPQLPKMHRGETPSLSLRSSLNLLLNPEDSDELPEPTSEYRMASSLHSEDGMSGTEEDRRYYQNRAKNKHLRRQSLQEGEASGEEGKPGEEGSVQQSGEQGPSSKLSYKHEESATID